MASGTTAVPNTDADDLSTITLMDGLLCLFALCLAAFITSANATTIVAIWRTPALRTLANTYVCSLAVADAVVGALCVLMALFMLPPVRLEVYNRHITMCSLFQGLNIGMVTVSALHMTLISVDRYLYIIRPYFYQRAINIRVISVFIGGVWVIGLVLAFLPQFITRPYGEVPLCDVTERLPIWFLFYTVSVLYFVSCAIDIAMYSIILRAAGRQRKAVQASVPAGPRPAAGAQGGHGGDGGTISKGKMKSIKFFLTVFGVFFTCITPTVLLLGLDFYVHVPGALYRFLNLVTLTNSGMNFLIYAAMNKQFRHAFLHTSALARCHAYLPCCCCSGADGESGGTGRMHDGKS